MKLKTTISAQISLSQTIESLSDRERVEWMTALLETISEDGTIAVLRDLVAQEQWNDQT